MEPLESHVLLVDNAGGFAVGAIDETFGPGQDKYVNTESGTGFSTGWTHVVAVGPNILFVRDDGRFAVGHIDQGKPTGLPHYVNTQSGTDFSTGWSHVVAVGPHVLFVNSNTGRFAVGHIDESTRQYVNTESGTGFSTGWTHVVAVGPNILFVRDDGLFAVGHIDQGKPTGLPHYVNTQSGTDLAFAGWTHIVAVGPHILFVDSNPPGRYEVGHIDLSTGTFKSTAGPEAHAAFAGATHVVAVGSYILSGRDDAFEVGYIDEASSDYVITQKLSPGVGGFPGPFHLVAVGPHVLGVSPTRERGFVLHIDLLGQSSETDSGPDFASNWTHVVAVA